MQNEIKPAAILLGSRRNLPFVYPADLLLEISRHVTWLIDPRQVLATPVAEQSRLALPVETEIIFSTWGMPRLEEAFLDKLPNLRAVFYGAGSVRNFVTEASWRRGVRIFSAAAANAIPVAEFTVAHVILGLKKAHLLREEVRGSWRAASSTRKDLRGNYGSRVGLISYGSIARHVRRLLRSYELEVWVYDPFLNEKDAQKDGIRLAGLEQIFRECHAVSVHTPWLKETENLVRGHHLASMQEDAIFINTARGAIVHQAEMTEVLRRRPDLLAVLDVLYPEPPADDEPILALGNAWVTPHIAGSMDYECGRMGKYALEAFRQFRGGSPSHLEVTEADMATMA